MQENEKNTTTQKNKLSNQNSSDKDSGSGQESTATDDMLQKYKKKGINTVSYAEYMALKEKNAKRKKLKLPKPVKAVINIFAIILFAASALFLLYMLYLIIINPYVGYNVPRADTRTNFEKTADKRYK